MRRKSWVLDEPVYGLLVDLWGKTCNVRKAWEWYQAMLHASLHPNVPTCNSLLSAFLRVHQLSNAYNLLQGMLTLGLKPSLQTYTLLSKQFALFVLIFFALHFLFMFNFLSRSSCWVMFQDGSIKKIGICPLF
ncbi:hypothetical protein Pint_32062 [Pistacia integerrima]|uniref:Uncharacterized protein n=1 Tax=Pistacia integerrima TaxID=434235 RepID=A0ACC0XR12_9ROSI|nr:hypothetical protein Pint_32062 [Pistacia integerrima]